MKAARFCLWAGAAVLVTVTLDGLHRHGWQPLYALNISMIAFDFFWLYYTRRYV